MNIRPIVSPASQEKVDEKKKKRNKYLGIGLLLIMAISSIGYAFLSGDDSSDSSNNSNQGEGIFQQGEVWVARYGDLELVFNSGPDEARNVSSNVNVNLNNFTNGRVYAVDDENYLQGLLSQSVGKYVEVRNACYGQCEDDLPEKTCDGEDYLIIWNRNSTNGLIQNNKCIFVNGDINAVDSLVYRLFDLI